MAFSHSRRSCAACCLAVLACVACSATCAAVVVISAAVITAPDFTLAFAVSNFALFAPFFVVVIMVKILVVYIVVTY